MKRVPAGVGILGLEHVGSWNQNDFSRYFDRNVRGNACLLLYCLSISHGCYCNANQSQHHCSARHLAHQTTHFFFPPLLVLGSWISSSSEDTAHRGPICRVSSASDQRVKEG